MIGSLTLDQLRILVAIADSGSFSAAGRQLGRAQSAISQSVATLEEMQDVRLFDREGYRPTLTDVGRVLVDQARLVLASAARFQAVAANTRQGLEAELAIAIDPMVPSEPLIESLRLLNSTYPDLPVRFSTEGLGGALRRVRDGSVAIGIGLLLPAVPDDILAHRLHVVSLVPVVARGHPLALLGRPASPADLEPHVQLVLSDPAEAEGPDYGIASARPWRFVDLGRRMDFLIAGFGWCRMPRHLVDEHIRTGRLVELKIEAEPTQGEGITIYAAHRRDHVPGPAGRWLLERLRADTTRSTGFGHGAKTSGWRV